MRFEAREGKGAVSGPNTSRHSLKCDPYLGVSKPLAGDFRMDAGRQQMCCMGVAQIMVAAPHPRERTRRSSQSAEPQFEAAPRLAATDTPSIPRLASPGVQPFGPCQTLAACIELLCGTALRSEPPKAALPTSQCDPSATRVGL